jgi:hypothetical protein
VCSFPLCRMRAVRERGMHPPQGQVARPRSGSRGIARSRTRPAWARV